jgi:hypothetical protein
VFDFIRDAANVNIVIAPEARAKMDAQTVTVKLTTPVTTLSALQHVLRQVGMVATYGDEAFIITTSDAAQPHPQVTIHDIRDLTEANRAFRPPPTIFGAQVDPLYYGWIHARRGERVGMDGHPDPFHVFETVDRYPPDQIGAIIAATVQRMAAAKNLDVYVEYFDGYLVVVHQPKAPRVQVAPDQLERATTGK